MKKNLRICFFLIATLITLPVLAQDRTVSGKVTDQTGGGLPGASIIIKGTTTGTATDMDGNYTLAVSEGAVLLIQAVGYKNQEITVGAQSVINLSMQEDVKQLSDVVVTALGISQERKALGYSIQEVKADQIKNSQETNVVNTLSGKVAGVQITSSSGAAGASANIRIRGNRSITGNNSPLFVIDGVPMNNEQIVASNDDNNEVLGSVALSNRAIDLNPNDIESMTVLKGASAAALYGTRAANGVILITTKKGKKSEKGFTVNFNTSLSLDRVNKLPGMQKTYSRGRNGKFSGDLRTWGNKIGDPNADYSSSPLKDDGTPEYGNQTYDNLGNFFQTGKTFSNSISVSGANDKTSFYFSASNLNQSGIVPLNDFKRTTVKASGDLKIAEKLTVTASATYSKSGGRRIQQGSNTSGVMLSLLRTPPNFDITNGATDPTDPRAFMYANGTQRSYNGGRFDSPYWSINKNPFVDDVNRLIAFGKVDYDIMPWLKATYRLGTDMYTDRRKQEFSIGSASESAGRLFYRNIFYREFTSDLFVNASHDFSDKFGGSILIGNQLNQRFRQDVDINGTNLVVPDFYNISNASTQIPREYQEVIRTAGVFAELQANYNKTVFLTVTGRNEKASTFGVAKNSFFYPSTSLSFVLSEVVDIPSVSFAKLRANYAQVGNQPTPYQIQNVYASQYVTDGWIQPSGLQFPFQGQVGFTQNDRLKNANLRPERIKSYEFGMEVKFLQDRISLDVNYYNSRSEDQIFPVPISYTSGYAEQVLNSGVMENKGWEALVTATAIKTKNFSWDITLNWSRNRNKVLKLAEGIDNIRIVGFTGINSYAVEGYAYGTIFGEAFEKTTDGKLIVDGPNGANPGFPRINSEEVVLGNPNPDWIGGIRNTFTYKSFTLSALIDIKHGGDLWNGTRGAMNSYGTHIDTENRDRQVIFDAVVDNGDGTFSPNSQVVYVGQNWYGPGSTGQPGSGLGNSFTGPSGQFVEDASWTRLRELALTYTLPRSILGKSPFTAIDLTFAGRNLLLFTPYKGVDPETNLSGATNGIGLDYFQMPNTKSYTFSLRVTL